ncbi:MAG: processing protein DprA, partial [Actinomycetota bacterium]
AALSEVLVVVESRSRGGSMITVAEAHKRDVCVMAVPGFPGAPASEGTNSLIADGCAPVTSVDDVLAALGLDTRRVSGWFDSRRVPSADEARVLAAFARRPRTVDELGLILGVTALDAAVVLGRLESAGWVASSDGWWEALVGVA